MRSESVKYAVMLSAALILSRSSMTAMSLKHWRPFLMAYTYNSSPSSTWSTDHIKVVARLRRCVGVDGPQDQRTDRLRKPPPSSASRRSSLQASRVGGSKFSKKGKYGRPQSCSLGERQGNCFMYVLFDIAIQLIVFSAPEPFCAQRWWLFKRGNRCKDLNTMLFRHSRRQLCCHTSI